MPSSVVNTKEVDNGSKVPDLDKPDSNRDYGKPSVVGNVSSDGTLPGPPLGLMSVLENSDNCKVVGVYDSSLYESYDEFFNTIERDNNGSPPKVLAISATTPTFRPSLNVAEKARRIYGRKIKIVLGGAHSTLRAKEILEKFPDVFDACYQGECERAFDQSILSLVEGNREKLRRVPGVAFWLNPKEGKPFLNTRARYIKDLDSLKYPDRSLSRIPVVHESPVYRPDRFSKVISLITDRGCGLGCSFCSSDALRAGAPYRARSPQKVIEELEYLMDDFGVDAVHFENDNFALRKKEALELAKAIQKFNEKRAKEISTNGDVPLVWSCETRPDRLDEETVEALVNAGCRVFYFGIESANRKILSDNKGLDWAKFIRLLDVLHQYENPLLRLFYSVQFGLPGETDETVMETVKEMTMICRRDVDSIQPHLTTVLPGTKLSRTSEVKGTRNQYGELESYEDAFNYEGKLQDPRLTESLRRIYNHGVRGPLIPRLEESGPRFINFIDKALKDLGDLVNFKGLWLGADIEK